MVTYLDAHLDLQGLYSLFLRVEDRESMCRKRGATLFIPCVSFDDIPVVGKLVSIPVVGPLRVEPRYASGRFLFQDRFGNGGMQITSLIRERGAREHGRENVALLTRKLTGPTDLASIMQDDDLQVDDLAGPLVVAKAEGCYGGSDLMVSTEIDRLFGAYADPGRGVHNVGLREGTFQGREVWQRARAH